MENHPFELVNPLFHCPFSIANCLFMFVYQRVIAIDGYNHDNSPPEVGARPELQCFDWGKQWFYGVATK